MRRFELVGGTSSKFWEITVTKSSIELRWGRRGTKGQSKPKAFASEDDAAKEAEKLIAKKLKEGYSEVTAKASPPQTPRTEASAAPKRPSKKSARKTAPEKDGEVLALLAKTATHVRAIRSADNGTNLDAEDAALTAFAELFAHGMIDTWSEDEGEAPPTADDWDRNLEPLAPGSAWGTEAVARFHRVCGDLNLLHSNDAGLNAAKDNYEAAIPGLRSLDPASAVVALARMLRASVYASYGDVIEANDALLQWALEAVRDMPGDVRDELEISFVEMTEWCGTDPPSKALASMFRRTLFELCSRADRLPYRRGEPWMALAGRASTPWLEGHLAPFYDLTRTSDVGALVATALDRATALEDGIFYPHGGAMSPAEYRQSTGARVAKLRKQWAKGPVTSPHARRRQAIEALDASQVMERFDLELEALSFIHTEKEKEQLSRDVIQFVAWMETLGDELLDLWDVLDVPGKLVPVRKQSTDPKVHAAIDRLLSLKPN